MGDLVYKPLDTSIYKCTKRVVWRLRCFTVISSTTVTSCVHQVYSQTMKKRCSTNLIYKIVMYKLYKLYTLYFLSLYVEKQQIECTSATRKHIHHLKPVICRWKLVFIYIKLFCLLFLI